MAVKITEAQALYLRYLRDGGPREGRPHGLVQKGLINYKWGTDPSYGYDLTGMGRIALKAYEQENK